MLAKEGHKWLVSVSMIDIGFMANIVGGNVPLDTTSYISRWECISTKSTSELYSSYNQSQVFGV